MKRLPILFISFLTLFLLACGGNSSTQLSNKDTTASDNLFIGETASDAQGADTLLFKSFPEAVASITTVDDVYGVWTRELGGDIMLYYVIYRADGMYWLRNVRQESGKYRLDDEKLSIQLKAINKVEFQDMQNDGGYRLTDSTLVVYDAQNYAQELGRRLFEWNK